MAKHTRNERPEVKLNVRSFDYPNAVRVEILILGADRAVRNKVKKTLLKAVKSVTGGEP